MKFDTKRAKSVYDELKDAVEKSSYVAAQSPDMTPEVVAEFAKAFIMAADVALKYDVALVAAKEVMKMSELQRGLVDDLKGE